MLSCEDHKEGRCIDVSLFRFIFGAFAIQRIWPGRRRAICLCPAQPVREASASLNEPFYVVADTGFSGFKYAQRPILENYDDPGATDRNPERVQRITLSVRQVEIQRVWHSSISGLLITECGQRVSHLSGI